jgi:TfoX/Sxy family transcriptional regulator of competence genes
MAYDPELADRIRELVTGAQAPTEQKMFGGLAFLVGGHMAVAASREGGVLVRVDPAEAEHLLATTGAEEMVMRGRSMRGWLRVAAADVATQEQLEEWVERGMSYAGALPPKAPKKRSTKRSPPGRRATPS